MMSNGNSKMSFWTLTCFNEDKKNEEIFDLNYGLNNIGRAWNNTVVLHNETISRHHCQLWIENSCFPIIKDLGSKNGTIVQGIRLESLEDYILKEHDMICLSDYQKESVATEWAMKFLKQINSNNSACEDL